MGDGPGRRGQDRLEVAEELACDWHTVNDAVTTYGTRCSRRIANG